MLLPNRTHAYIPENKLTEYLLSDTHHIGKAKAKFFNAFGFDKSNITFLENGLIKIAQNETVRTIKPNPYGTKYIIDGKLDTPDGSQISVRTVWIIETGEYDPRFVTAHPIKNDGG